MNIQKNVSLKAYNTFGLNVSADYFLNMSSAADYDPQFLTDYESVFILGGGSNILLAKNISGLVLKVDILGKEIIEENEESVIVKIGAGEHWHQFVLWTLKQGWSGVENLSSIPGTMGAAPMQNIGAYGVELADVLEKVEGIFLGDGSPFTLTAAQCQLGYRSSIFKNEWKGKVIITQVYLKLAKNFKPNISYGAISAMLESWDIDSPTAADVSKAVIHIRQSKLPDPTKLGNAGSFFKNPVIPAEQFAKLKSHFPDIPHYPAGEDLVKIPAGWLIEQNGWKGKKIGATGSHAQQALVLVNYGEATGTEIFQLSEDILQSVKEKFGIDLEREVTVV